MAEKKKTTSSGARTHGGLGNAHINRGKTESHSQDARRGGLGRGLAALIPQQGSSSRTGMGAAAADIVLGSGNTHAHTSTATAQPSRKDTASAAPASHGASFGASYQELPIGRIVPNAKQPRTYFDEDALEELVHSIKEFGLMQPIVVRRSPDLPETYELIMGERRLRAATKAGFTVIPAIIRETDDSEMLRNALLENIHRVQLNPLEEAAAYQQLLNEFGVTQAQLADTLGRSRPLITNMIRLLALPVPVQRKVASGVLSAGHARALLSIKVENSRDAVQNSLADRIVAEGLSVRATEELVTLINRGEKAPTPKKTTRHAPPQPEFVSTAQRVLSDDLDTKVSVTMGKRKGKIVVEFGDKDDLERIMALLRSH